VEVSLWRQAVLKRAAQGVAAHAVSVLRCALYDLQDEIDEYQCGDYEDFECFVEDVKNQLADIGEECQSSLDNMPESLQYAPTGELLQERIDACESAQYEMDVDEFEFEPEDFEDYEEVTGAEMSERKDEAFQEWLGDAKDQLKEAVTMRFLLRRRKQCTR
jgi:hypothetical protein